MIIRGLLIIKKFFKYFISNFKSLNLFKSYYLMKNYNFYKLNLLLLPNIKPNRLVEHFQRKQNRHIHYWS